MTSAIIGNISPAFLPSRLINSRTRLLFGPKYYTPVLFKRCGFAANVCAASSTAFVKTKPTVSAKDNILACPACYAPLTSISEGVLSVDSAADTKLHCDCCEKSYSGTETHLELTATTGARKYGDAMPMATEISESMLQQCYEFIKQEENISKELPFVSCSVDAVHAGAAIHCWSSPTSAVAEICRVLKTEGVFVGTTFLLDGPSRFLPLVGPLRQNMSQISGSHVFADERELEDICTACGLVGFTSTRNRQFIMFSAKKPI